MLRVNQEDHIIQSTNDAVLSKVTQESSIRITTMSLTKTLLNIMLIINMAITFT